MGNSLGGERLGSEPTVSVPSIAEGPGCLATGGYS